MISKLAGILSLSLLSFSALSQTTEPAKKTGRPDIPGTFTVELGINRALNTPDDFTTGLWGSRSVNIYYQYELRILKSRFSFVPGVGLSLERFKWRNGQVLGYQREDNLFNEPILSTDTMHLFSMAQHQIPGLRKSQLVTNYVDVPLELRYTFNPDDPARSVKIGVGARVGYLYDAFNKLKMKQDGETMQIKDKQNFNLTRFRYGVFAKLSFGNFSLFGYYNLTPLFQDGKGLYSEKNVPFNELNTFTGGISLSSF